MHMQHPLATAPLVQVIDILGDEQKVAHPFPLQPRKRAMRRIWHDLGQLRAPLVIEAMDQRGVARQRLGRAHILDPVPFPQATWPAKGCKPALGGNSRACEDDKGVIVWHRPGDAQPEGKTQAMTAIGIIGSAGRMGKAIEAELAARGLSCAGGVDRDAGDLAALAQASDVLIDFSAPAALKANLEACLFAGKPVVIGTTGLEESHHRLIDAAAHSLPVLQTGNTSFGVNLLAALVEEAARRLDDDWDVEIIEMHHRHKVDAPSGTALLLGEAAAKGRGIELAAHSERGRDGITGARAKGTIGFASLRGGSVPGDHSVILATEGESITLSHRAENRTIFARGAVKAALWLKDQPAGRYDMKSVLGL